ncbi:adenosylmethionine-8-amino-7-oxononanoate aminotransferase [Aeromicrobium sp. Root236]|uniref:adenosylmethionine--8-amino-7-oxononanoate transaminase n=1 Tax=Aeromicrobium sp. Root236 TaxID=1736498 RepID=UPI00070054EE|nr:adenosylmethionine--8-amino-7-oxononanoate transaminase [Aeromicrobium sp. Root236]KRC65727.1 adenosylmethionine-8-amino-7-oxononanoate aminotransferase [Aeromicrobium sp. Root236]
MDDLIEFDRAHVWHPYAPMSSPATPLLVTGAAGNRLTLADGREPIDAMSSWWAAIHGYRHPRLDAALHRQADSMSHVMFGGLTHEPAIELARRLLDLAPAGLDKVFFADSGSVSVEVALKMSLQLQRGTGHPGRTRFLTLRGGYHGDTFGAMSVCDPVGGMHQMFTDVLAEQVFLPRPPAGLDADADTWIAEAQTVIDRLDDTIAAVIVEPVLQGAGGMHVYPPAVLRWLREVCDARGWLLVLDEIATGFARTGEMFAADHAGISPDIMCVGKALTGGYLTLAAVLCTPEVAAGIDASESGALMHGPTYMANPLACAVAAASLDVLTESDWRLDIARINAALETGLAPARELAGVADVRTLGAVGVLQLDHPVDVAAASAVALDHGVWIRPFRDLIYTMPPYISTDEDLGVITGALVAAAGSPR